MPSSPAAQRPLSSRYFPRALIPSTWRNDPSFLAAQPVLVLRSHRARAGGDRGPGAEAARRSRHAGAGRRRLEWRHGVDRARESVDANREPRDRARRRVSRADLLRAGASRAQDRMGSLAPAGTARVAARHVPEIEALSQRRGGPASRRVDRAASRRREPVCGGRGRGRRRTRARRARRTTVRRPRVQGRLHGERRHVGRAAASARLSSGAGQGAAARNAGSRPAARQRLVGTDASHRSDVRIGDDSDRRRDDGASNGAGYQASVRFSRVAGHEPVDVAAVGRRSGGVSARALSRAHQRDRIATRARSRPRARTPSGRVWPATSSSR